MAELTVKEITQLQYEAKIALLQTVIDESNKYVYYEEKLDKNLLSEKFINRLSQMKRELI